MKCYLLRTGLENLMKDVQTVIDKMDGEDNHLTSEQMDDVLKSLLTQLDIGIEDITKEDIEIIYKALNNNSDEFEFALPRIKYVIKHWYKDVDFSDAYSKINVVELPIDVNNDNLKVTATLSGATSYRQTNQPYVVKGDIVTLDGEIVENSPLENSTIEDSEGREYKWGDGYRTAKKLFTQGQYYTYDGTSETSKSIYYAKQIEKLKNSIDEKESFAKAYVQDGRLILVLRDDQTDNEVSSNYSANGWDISSQEIVDERKGEDLGDIVVTGDGWSLFHKMASVSGEGKNIDIYYIKADKDLKYVSVADDVEKSKKSVGRINSLLEAMGVITTRRPISFDNTTASGDVTTLTAFGILEGMHTEAAEYIYKDLKEFLIELGYYTKAEFEYIETNVLEWFIPEYMPSTEQERNNWKQNKKEDALLYGAIIYPEEVDENGNVTQEGFKKELDVIAPGNCRIMEMSDNSITLEFDGISQPEIGMLDRYTMIIDGITLDGGVTVDVIDPSGNESQMTLAEVFKNERIYIIKSGSVIGKTGADKIQVIMKNSRGGYIDDIEDYMAPEIHIMSGDSSAFSITGTVLTENEFVALCLNYMNSNGINNSDFSESNLREFYKVCKKYAVNPEYAFTTAVTESGLTYGEAVRTHNYWGWNVPNGGSYQQYDSMLKVLEGYCNTIVSYQDPTTSEYNTITQRYEERKNCTENGGCNPNGYGMPNTIQGLQSLYSWIGNHVYGDSSNGGYYFLDPARTGVSVVYKTHEEFIKKCKNVHPEGSPPTVWEQNEYTAYQVEQKIDIAKRIFGENAGKYML